MVLKSELTIRKVNPSSLTSLSDINGLVQFTFCDYGSKIDMCREMEHYYEQSKQRIERVLSFSSSFENEASTIAIELDEAKWRFSPPMSNDPFALLVVNISDDLVLEANEVHEVKKNSKHILIFSMPRFYALKNSLRLGEGIIENLLNQKRIQ